MDKPYIDSIYSFKGEIYYENKKNFIDYFSIECIDGT